MFVSLPSSLPVLRKVGMRVWPPSVEGPDRNRWAIHTESSSTPSSQSCQCSHLVRSMASAYAFHMIRYSSCTGSCKFLVQCERRPRLWVFCFISASSFVHHRLEYRHGWDAGTIEDSRCGNVAEMLGQFEVEVVPVCCLEIEPGQYVELSAFHVNSGYDW